MTDSETQSNADTHKTEHTMATDILTHTNKQKHRHMVTNTDTDTETAEIKL